MTDAASPAPQKEILDVAKEILAAKGVTLDIKEFTDYVQPNNVVESDDMSLDKRAATLIEMYTKGENLNDLVCWYLVNKRDIFSNYRTEGIISSWGSLCRNIINDCFDEAVKDNDELSQQKLKDCYKANKLDDIYHYTNPQDVADILMKEIDFLRTTKPFDDYISDLINDDSLIKKPWQH